MGSRTNVRMRTFGKITTNGSLFNNYTVVISRCFDCSLNFAPNRQRNKAKYDDKNTNAKPGDQRTNKYIKDSLKLLHLLV